MPTRRTPGQRAGLTHAGVVTAARDLLAERGPEGLTMRSLAERLAVSPNALYSHVESKVTLIDDVLDGLLADVQAPGTDTEPPAAGLRDVMASTYEVLIAHPGLVGLYLARQGARGPNAQRLGGIMLDLLAAAGVTGAAAREALRVLIVYTIGFAAFTTRGPLTAADGPGASGDELTRNFDSGLRWLLAGVVAVDW